MSERRMRRCCATPAGVLLPHLPDCPEGRKLALDLAVYGFSAEDEDGCRLPPEDFKVAHATEKASHGAAREQG